MSGATEPSFGDIGKRIALLLADVLGLADASHVATARRDTTSEWDSVSHLRLILALEDEFGITIQDADVVRLSRLDDIVILVEQELNR